MTILSEFIQITAEVIIWSALFILGGILLILLLTSLFSTIGINANSFIMNNIVTLGLCAAPYISLIVLERIDKNQQPRSKLPRYEDNSLE